MGCAAVSSFTVLRLRRTELELTENQIKVGGAIALGQALKSTSSLTRISVAYNCLGDDGAAAIAQGLLKNRSAMWRIARLCGG